MPKSFNVLVTRAENEQEHTADLLRKQGFNPIPCPLFELSFLACPQLNWEKYQGIIATSRNGVRALSSCENKNILLIVVGEETAHFAKKSGFQHVVCAGHTALELVSWVKTHMGNQHGPFLYGRGEIIRWDLCEILRESQILVDEIFLYALKPIKCLPLTIVSCLKKQEFWGALFFSQVVARYFKKLVEKENLASSLSSMCFFGLSEEILEPLKMLGRERCASHIPHITSLTHLMTEKKVQDLLE